MLTVVVRMDIYIYIYILHKMTFLANSLPYYPMCPCLSIITFISNKICNS